MSDTDDTDLLLLFPPDFFIVNTDDDPLKEAVTRNVEREVVSDLISQVNDLESRICAIEKLDSSSSKTEKEFSRNDTERYLINDSIHQQSDISNFVGDLSPNSCKGGRGSVAHSYSHPLIASSPIVERTVTSCLGLQSEMESSLGKIHYSPSKRLDLPEVDRLLSEMEATQAEIESKLREREAEFGINNSKSNQPETKVKTYKLGDDVGSIPDLGFGIRGLFAKSPSSSPSKNQGEKTDSRSPAVEDPCVKKNMYSLGSSASRIEGVTPNHRTYNSHDYAGAGKSYSTLNSSSSPERSRSKPPRRKLFIPSEGLPNRNIKSSIEHSSLFSREKPAQIQELKSDKGESEANRFEEIQSIKRDLPQFPEHTTSKTTDPTAYSLGPSGDKLLSLTDLWKPEEFPGSNPLRLKQKLEEEKYRRLHLEETVHSLHKKVLEEQERVAVAMKVDEAKDKAIEQIMNAWRQMVEHWKKLEEQRHQATQTLISERAIFKKGQEDIGKKIERWEKEVSQALDLAAGFKKKAEKMEEELNSAKFTMQRKSGELEEKLRIAEEKIKQLEEERRTLASRLQISEEEHDQERQVVSDVRADLSKAEDCLSKSLAELAVVKEQRDLLSTRLKEERGRITTLEQQKKALQDALSDAKLAQTKAEEESKEAVGALERAKGELRGVYQAQLESVVREKLEEFQGQLDRAQAAMQAQLQEAQREAREKALQQQNTLVNSHIIEMRKLESLHKEEINTLETKLFEVQRRCARLESGKKEIAQKLHSVMESQWQQALSIITSELSFRQADADPVRQRVEGAEGRQESGTRSSGVSSLGPSDEAPFNRDGQLTYRLAGPTLPPAPPPPQPPDQPAQDKLMTYIQMLLDRQPGHPVESAASSGILNDLTVSDVTLEEPADMPKWNEIMLKRQDTEQNDPRAAVSRPKPPWK